MTNHVPRTLTVALICINMVLIRNDLLASHGFMPWLDACGSCKLTLRLQQVRLAAASVNYQKPANRLLLESHVNRGNKPFLGLTWSKNGLFELFVYVSNGFESHFLKQTICVNSKDRKHVPKISRPLFKQRNSLPFLDGSLEPHSCFNFGRQTPQRTAGQPPGKDQDKPKGDEKMIRKRMNMKGCKRFFYLLVLILILQQDYIKKSQYFGTSRCIKDSTVEHHWRTTNRCGRAFPYRKAPGNCSEDGTANRWCRLACAKRCTSARHLASHSSKAWQNMGRSPDLTFDFPVVGIRSWFHP